MVTVDQAQQLLGARVVDAGGDKVGTVNEVYLDDVTGEPSWVTVATGWFGLSESFVPLDRALINDDLIQVPFDKATIKDAPRHDGGEPLSPKDEDDLYRHYSLATGASGTVRDADIETESAADADISGAATPDESLIRWEEQSSVRPGSRRDKSVTGSEGQWAAGSERMRTGRARLRKYVVTEQQTVTVPVTHEEARLEREPITEADQNRESTGAPFAEEEREIVLHAERPVVTTESVPVERVRLDGGTVTKEATATDNVRSEYLERAGGQPADAQGADRVTPRSMQFGGRR